MQGASHWMPVLVALHAACPWRTQAYLDVPFGIPQLRLEDAWQGHKVLLQKPPILRKLPVNGEQVVPGEALWPVATCLQHVHLHVPVPG